MYFFLRSITEVFVKEVAIVFFSSNASSLLFNIIPQAQMGSESIAHEAEGRMGDWLRAHGWILPKQLLF